VVRKQLTEKEIEKQKEEQKILEQQEEAVKV